MKVFHFLFFCVLSFGLTQLNQVALGQDQEADEESESEVIRFADDELAQETVLPLFDPVRATQNRNVITAKKFELGIFAGANFTEPILNQSKFGLNLGYNTSEDRAINVNFSSWVQGLNTQYTDGIKEEADGTNPFSTQYDFNRSPKLKYSLFVDYEWKLFYGKISITKGGVTNLTLYPFAGIGVNVFQHKALPGIEGGIGQKYYFGKSVALRIDFKLQVAQMTSPFASGALRNGDPVNPNVFPDKIRVNSIVDVGLSFLF